MWQKRVIDVTNRILEEPVLEGKLKVYDYMMRQNKGVYIGEGYDLYGQKAVKTTKVSKKRNRYAKKPNRKHGLYNNNR